VGLGRVVRTKRRRRMKRKRKKSLMRMELHQGLDRRISYRIVCKVLQAA
jgi:hypothetical protein